MSVKLCVVSFADIRGIKHSVEVEAESLYEAAVQGIRRLNQDPWMSASDPALLCKWRCGNPLRRMPLLSNRSSDGLRV